jgi:serine/threonine protein kinase/tetratricopeptide (TPR) repeat protein
MIGKQVSHYKILSKLGEGGMGIVYEAQDTKLDRTVALKFLPPELMRDEDSKTRFIHEAKAAAALSHPNICTIFEIDEAEGQTFIAMECVEGMSLKERIAGGPLALEQAIDVASQILQGLQKAHEKGIVHRDIKPGNIMLTADGRAKIMDFGLAKLSGATKVTKTGTTVGTAAYMSPEQARGDEIDRRSDIWSVGVMLHEMLTGQVPFRGEYGEAVLYSILNEAPEPVTSLRTGVPIDLERVVEKALTKNPAERYQHAEEMLVDLRRAGRKAEPARSKGPARSAVEVPRKRPVRRIALPIGIAVILALFFLLLRPILFEQVLVSEPKPIAVMSFTNKTGDETYDYLQEAIPDLLITSLEQSRYLNVTTRERMRDLLRQMGKEDAEVVDEELGFELCRMDGIDAVVLGSFTKAGDMFATDVKVLDVETKRLLASASSREEGVASILEKQIDQLSRDISRGLGMSAREEEATQVRIAEVTTASMEAYNYFLRGREEYEKFYFQDAVRFLEKAVELDSTFAAAYLYLGEAYGRMYDRQARDAAFRKANALSGKVTDKERLYIEAQYAGVIEKDPKKRFKIHQQIATRYPREKLAHMHLGIHYRDSGQSEAAIEEFEKALKLDPYYGAALNGLAYQHADIGNFDEAMGYFERYAAVSPGDANPFDSMGELYLRMGRLDEAVAKYEEAIDVKPDFYGSYWSISYIHALKEDYPEALKWLDKSVTSVSPAGARATKSVFSGFHLAWLGDSEGAFRSLEELEGLSVETGNPGWKAVADWLRGHVCLERGELAFSREYFEHYRDYVVNYHSPKERAGRLAEHSFFMGLAYVREGRYGSARAKLAEMKSLLPEIDPAVIERETFYCDFLQAEILLAEGSPQRAIAVSREGWPLMGTLNYQEMGAYNVPFMKDVLARAYVANGEPDKAITEYERLTTFDPDSDDLRLIHPLYHYRLAKLYEEKGWSSRAMERYQRFLDIWKNAGADRPEVPDARARLSALSGNP